MKTQHATRLSLTGILTLICFVMAGCNATLPQTRVPVPVECREEIPERPVMPTEALPARVPLDTFVQAATAEIERREGYEVRMRAALVACTAPLGP